MQREAVGTSRLKAPDDGIVSSHRPRGRLGRRWLSLIESMGRAHATRVAQGREPYDRVARGRSWARGGRVRDLWFAPGIANAEVVGAQPHQVSIRVRVLDEAEWQRALAILASDLRFIAALMEGELPQEVLDAFAEAGLPLMPSADDLAESRCSCEDYALPCAHAAAVHHVLADALDGEPFLLLTLRGRPREQVLAGLRRMWGDTGPLRASPISVDEPPPEGDWFRAPTPLPPMTFSFSAAGHALGLLELGPPPGEGELERALRPLYEAGGKAALELAMSEEGPRSARARRRPRSRPQEETRPQENDGMSTTDAAADSQNAPEDTPGAPASASLAERLVDQLARVENAKSKELAEALGVSMIDVRHELIELEKMGIVYRTGQTRGTRWWLG